MGRHGAGTALGPPTPEAGAAGRASQRRAPSPTRTRALAAPVDGRTASKITGIVSSSSPRSAAGHESAGPTRGTSAGKPTAGREGFDAATGTAHVRGKKGLASPKAAAGSPASSSRKQASKKQYMACASTQSTGVEGALGACGGGFAASPADPRDFSKAAGTPTSAAEHAGIFAAGHVPHHSAAYGASSTADSLIFNRDIDVSDGLADPRESAFAAAAGARSEALAMAPPMTIPQHADRLGAADIPRAQFSAPGLKRVDGGAASRTEAHHHMFPGELTGPPQRGPQHAPTAAIRGGAAGASTDQSDARWQRDLNGSRAKLRTGEGAQAEALVFGHTMAPSPPASATGGGTALGDSVYSGAGARAQSSSAQMAWNELHDVSVRAPGTRPTDHQWLQRDFGSSAGARAVDLAEKRMGSLDITAAPHLGNAGNADMDGRVGASTGFLAASQAHRALEDARGVRQGSTILNNDDATSAYEASSYAGVGSRFMGPGEPGQRKWNIGSDFVMVKPIEDISVSFMHDHYKNPYAG